MKKILVIMPVYNQEGFVEAAIQSVIQQTHTNWELILIDDKSTDDSLDIARTYSEKYSKITLLENSVNRGCYYTRNRGLYEFKDKDWDFFTIHDPDDISDVTRFEKILKSFEDVDVVAMLTTYIKKDVTTGEYIVKRNGKYDIYASEGIAIYRRIVFDKLGYFDDTRFSGDTEYVHRIMNYNRSVEKTNFNIGKHTDILYICNIHTTNLTVLYPVTSRGVYYKKIKEDHKQMISTKNYYKKFIP
jgi:glycosyltransferase involved in cell wall biosynthesis